MSKEANFSITSSLYLNINCRELSPDINNIIEGCFDKVVDGTEGYPVAYTISVSTLLDTLDPEEGYNDAFKEEWEVFVRYIEKHAIISGAEYIMVR